MIFWGLIANMVGLDLWLFALPTLDRFAQRPAGRTLAEACGWIVLLHFAHELMALVAAGAIAVFAVGSCRRWKDAALLALPGMLVVALFGVAVIESAKLAATYHATYARLEWDGLGTKLDAAPSLLYESADAERWLRYVLFFACQLPAALFAAERWRSRATTSRGLRESLVHFRFEILAGLLILAYLAAPLSVKGTRLVYQRFLPPAWTLLLVASCARAPQPKPSPLPRLLSALMPLVPLLVTWPLFVESSATYRDLDAAITHLTPGSAYVVLGVGDPLHARESPASFDGHVVGALGGRGIFDATLSESSPVYQRVAAQWPSGFRRFYDAIHFLPSHDLSRYRYVLLYAHDLDAANLATLAMQPEAKLVFHQGEWTVLESTLPLAPLDAPDALDPDPWPKTLGDRAAEVFARLQRIPPAQRRLPLAPSTR
jgi:hypothetical protein